MKSVVVPEPPEPAREVPIDAYCAVCGFKLLWKVVTGRKSISALLWLVFLLPLYTSSAYPLGERQPQFRTVRRVVDGDTLVLENKERVRLIGVDTPETKHPRKPVEHFGKEATAFTRTMVQGKRVRLEFDQGNAHIGHKDKYRRTLAYVFLEDGTFLNAEIIKQGYGFVYSRFPFMYMDEFRRYERKARRQRAMGEEQIEVSGFSDGQQPNPPSALLTRCTARDRIEQWLSQQ